MAPVSPGSALATTSSASLSLQIQSPDDLQRLARLFSASGLFGRAAGNDRDAHMAECAIKILAGMEAGFGSFASIAGISVINGKPGFGANLLAQAIKRHPLYDYRVLEKTDQVCRIKFLAGKEELGIETFTIQMAERAGLIGKGGPWKQYPEAMLAKLPKPASMPARILMAHSAMCASRSLPAARPNRPLAENRRARRCRSSGDWICSDRLAELVVARAEPGKTGAMVVGWWLRES